MIYSETICPVSKKLFVEISHNSKIVLERLFVTFFLRIFVMNKAYYLVTLSEMSVNVKTREFVCKV